jgi:hypothetical protein
METIPKGMQHKTVHKMAQTKLLSGGTEDELWDDSIVAQIFDN